tara:strand:- start:80 stop:589 length:510 start_codon:yes stop_codon:yes gene_type:complete
METNFFENTQYKNKFTRKSLLLEIGLTQDTTNYTVTLPEELKIDNFSEVFVDTVVTNNIKINSVSAPDNLGMLLKIDGINTRTIGGDTTGTNNNYNGKFFIPNEAGPASAAASELMKIHKGRKQNYMGAIEAGRYRDFNITLSNLNNASIWVADSSSRFIIELIIIEKE